MDIANIAFAIALVTLVGILGAVILVLAAKYMHVEEDPRIAQVTECLPGANCGGCGYAGCADYAKAVVEGGAPVNKCAVGGAAAAAKIAEVMGVEAGASVKTWAVVGCQGENGVCNAKFDYQGMTSCAAAAQLFGGPNACAFGCIGLGDCVKACPFDAIHVVNGKARVDVDKCVGCGACKAACPKKIIWMHSEPKKPVVMCANHEVGGKVIKECTAGCIGCHKCEKVCPKDAIKVINNVARIDYDKCVGCGLCVKNCPKNVIKMPKEIKELNP